jgi:hypothetical protein
MKAVFRRTQELPNARPAKPTSIIAQVESFGAAETVIRAPSSEALSRALREGQAGRHNRLRLRQRSDKLLRMRGRALRFPG